MLDLVKYDRIAKLKIFGLFLPVLSILSIPLFSRGNVETQPRFQYLNPHEKIQAYCDTKEGHLLYTNFEVSFITVVPNGCEKSPR